MNLHIVISADLLITVKGHGFISPSPLLCASPCLSYNWCFSNLQEERRQSGERRKIHLSVTTNS